jgi:transposase InsO family protein
MARKRRTYTCEFKLEAIQLAETSDKPIAIVGWSMSSTMHASLVRNALWMAIANRQPQTGLLYHSDRGSQYAGLGRSECPSHSS